jgi:hypothetical protein
VYVEYGDDAHSKRLGKAGLPRRRRFKVLEYLPERGYVRIDTDGLRLLDKVSLHKVSRAPRDFSVRDNVTPITNLERKGQQELQLPPGWSKAVRQGSTRDYVEYHGPGGRGKAGSILQAWREHGSDPAFMPQPNLPTVRSPLTLPPPVAAPRRSLEQTALPVDAPSLTTNSDKSALLTRLMSAVEQLKTADKTDECMIDEWHVRYKLRNHPNTSYRGDWCVISPRGTRFASKVSLVRYFGLPDAVEPATTGASSYPQIGAYIEVYWTQERTHYAGRITGQRVDDGELQHRIHYDDGAIQWHDFATTQWRLHSTANSATISHIRASVMAQTLTQSCRKTRQQELRDRETQLARYAHACLMASSALDVMYCDDYYML